MKTIESNVLSNIPGAGLFYEIGKVLGQMSKADTDVQYDAMGNITSW